MATRAVRVEDAAETRGVVAARAARATVARHLEELLATADMTGSRAQIAQRMRTFFADEADGDAVVVRASAMEVAVAWAAYVAHLDMQLTDTIV